MSITRERFEQGLTAQEFIERMEVNKERFVDNIQANTLSFDDRQFFNEHPISIAALAEDWCTDVIQFLPVVVKLAEEVPAVELRIFERDENLDIMDQYLKAGEFRSIPTFIVYDRNWNEIGYYSERPDAVTKMMAEETRRFAQANPDLEGATRSYDSMPDETRQKVRANSARYRWENMLEWNRIFLDEIKALIESSIPATR